MLFYFKLQYKRIYRIIEDFGMPPFLGMVLVVSVFFMLSNMLFSKTDYASIIYTVVGLFYVFSFGNEQRNTFLKTVFSKTDFLKIRLLENLFIALPFTVFLILKAEFLYGFSLVFLSGISSFLTSSKKVSFVIPTPFYKYPFEFIIGFRRFFWVIFIVYSLTIIAINVGNFNLGIFALCVLCLLVPEFYKKSEPETFVWTHHLTPKKFLKRKILIAIKYSLWLSAPIHLALWIAFSKEFYVTIIFQVIGICFVIAYIFGKYKYYPKNMLITTGLTISVCLIFPPLFVVVIPYLYKEALANLNQFL